MKNSDFLYTSGHPSLLDDSLDYGIKRAPQNFSQKLLRGLEKNCDIWVRMLDHPSLPQYFVIVGKVLWRWRVILFVKVVSSEDHVQRKNFAIYGEVYHKGIPQHIHCWNLRRFSGESANLAHKPWKDLVAYVHSNSETVDACGFIGKYSSFIAIFVSTATIAFV